MWLCAVTIFRSTYWLLGVNCYFVEETCKLCCFLLWLLLFLPALASFQQVMKVLLVPSDLLVAGLFNQCWNVLWSSLTGWLSVTSVDLAFGTVWVCVTSVDLGFGTIWLTVCYQCWLGLWNGVTGVDIVVGTVWLCVTSVDPGLGSSLPYDCVWAMLTWSLE